MVKSRNSHPLRFLVAAIVFSVALLVSTTAAFAATSISSPSNNAEYKVGNSVTIISSAKWIRPQGSRPAFNPWPNYIYFKVTRNGERVHYEAKELKPLSGIGLNDDIIPHDTRLSFVPEEVGQYLIEACQDLTYEDSVHVDLAYEDFVADASVSIRVWKSIETAEVGGVTDKVYTGSAITQEPTVTLDGVELDPDTDYDVAITNNVNVGTATMTITGKGFYKGTATKEFEVTPATIPSSAVGGIVNKTYSGSALTQDVTVRVGNKLLVAGTDYEVSYENNVNAGTASVIVTGIGNYTGTATKTFTINKASIHDVGEPTLRSMTYTGSAITQSLSLWYGRTLVQGTDYTVTYANNVNPGTATVTITGIGNFKDSKVRTFSIVEPTHADGWYYVTAPVDGAQYAVGSTITAKAKSDIMYNSLQWVNGSGPYIEVSFNLIYMRILRQDEATGQNTLVAFQRFEYHSGEEVSLNFTPNVKGKYLVQMRWQAATADAQTNQWVFITEDTFTPHDSVTVYVGVNAPGARKDISGATVTGVTNKEYTGNSITQSPTVKLDGKTLKNGTDYYITYKGVTYPNDNIVNTGTVEMTIHGKGSYMGTVKKQFQITPKALTASMVTLSPTSFTYNGSLQKPQVTVMNGAMRLTVPANYTLTNEGGTEPGEYQVVVKASNGGNYSGTITKKYNINKLPLGNALVTLEPTSYIYDGVAKEPAVMSVSLDGVEVPESAYTVKYTNNTNAGTATVTVTALSSSYYTGSATASFAIGKYDIASSDVSVSALEDTTFNRKAQTPVPTVARGETPLAKDTDFTLAYTNNTNVGTAQVTIAGTGNYKGKQTTSFKIGRKDIGDASITVDPIPYQELVEGTPCEPQVLVRDGNELLTSDEVTITYSGNEETGTATVTIKGIGNYKGTRNDVTFRILGELDYAIASLQDKLEELAHVDTSVYAPEDAEALENVIAAAQEALENAIAAAQEEVADPEPYVSELRQALAAVTAAQQTADDNLRAAREEAERLAREEAERKAREEAARKAREEAAAAQARAKAEKAAAAMPSAASVEKSILAKKTDSDPAGSSYAPLQLKSSKQGKTYVKLTWKKISGASGYVIYANKCGKANRIKKIATTKKTSYKHKKLKKGTYYKYVVVAVKDTVLGKRAAAVSKMVHVATAGGKVGNTKSLTVKAKIGKKTKKISKATLKKGKTLKLKVTSVPVSKKRKVKQHVATRYESSNKAVATVSPKGKIKAKKKGSCTVRVYAQNGVCKKVKITVK